MTQLHGKPHLVWSAHFKWWWCKIDGKLWDYSKNPRDAVVRALHQHRSLK
jgi:hypothetical protein